MISKKANHMCPSEPTMSFPGYKCPCLGWHHYHRGCWRYSLGEPSLQHLVTEYGQTGQTGRASTCHGEGPSCPRRQSWDLGLLCPGGKQQRDFLENSHALLSLTIEASWELFPGCNTRRRSCASCIQFAQRSWSPPQADAVHPNFYLARRY